VAQGEKLVRDRIPEIIRASGSEPVIRVADAASFRGLLEDKLLEEVTSSLYLTVIQRNSQTSSRLSMRWLASSELIA
jgi:predicted house-cleaning noncanonical NTP pyrophosphatase (MazG superfamily)